MSEPHVGMMVTPSVCLVSPLGAGGMGSVWVADHLALRIKVVVKFIANDLAKNTDALARFSREAAAAAQVKSPHVVQTLDHGVSEDGAPYIVMELLEGGDLGARLEGSAPMSPIEVVNVVVQLARALDRAHGRGIVHRDIKPNNIFLCDAGNNEVFVKLLDFGIAKYMDSVLLDSGTKTGSMVGTPYYMSPEQVLGAKDIDFRTDLWSVGVVAFEALTGTKPFDAATVGGIAIKIHSEPLPNPSAFNSALPAAVDKWFTKACARKADERFSGAKEMADALALAITGEVMATASSSSSRSRSISKSPSFAPEALAATAHANDVRSATDSGLERSGPAAGVNGGKLALVAGILVAVGFAGFLVPHWLKGGEPVSASPIAPTGVVISTALPTATLTAAPGPTPAPGASLSAAPATSAMITTPTVKPRVHHAAGKASASAAPNAAAPVPLPSPGPSASGHDIF